MPDYKPSTCTLLLELLSGEGTVLETKALTALLLSFSWEWREAHLSIRIIKNLQKKSNIIRKPLTSTNVNINLSPWIFSSMMCYFLLEYVLKLAPKDYIIIQYRKIPKISPWAYIFQRPFLRGLYAEGLICGGKRVVGLLGRLRTFTRPKNTSDLQISCTGVQS